MWICAVQKIVIIWVLCLINITQVNAMGLFDFLKINVFTETEGILTQAGKPLSEVEIRLDVRVVFNDEQFHVNTKTNSEGKFKFAEIKANSINTILPSAKMVNQKIVATYQEKEYVLWDMVKNNYEKNGELNDLSESNNALIPMVLNCDLDNELKTRRAGTHEHVALSGICRLDNEK